MQHRPADRGLVISSCGDAQSNRGGHCSLHAEAMIGAPPSHERPSESHLLRNVSRHGHTSAIIIIIIIIIIILYYAERQHKNHNSKE